MQRICTDCYPLTIATALSPIHIWVRVGTDNQTASAPMHTDLPLHVYIENDGAAYVTPTQIAANPSVRAEFLVLRLMQQDENPSIYLGRPCYGFAVNQMPVNCQPRYWSNARYSAEVVRALTQALEQTKKQLNKIDAPIVLIGHSGGGSLALLIAQGRSDVLAVVTLAGNLDTDSWVKLHGYGELNQSLNPQVQPLLPRSVKRWHFAGADDKNIPPILMAPICKKDSTAHCQILAGVAHNTGWIEQWPRLLSHINAHTAAH